MTEALFVVLLAVVALVPRLYFSLRYGAEPVWDGHYYDFGARRIAAGLGYSDDLMVNGHAVWHPWCHYPVGYSAVLGTFYHLFGASVRTAAVLNSGIGAALAVATWWVATAAMSRPRARAAGVLVALHPGLLLYSALTMTEPLAALLTLVAFGLALRTRDPWRGAAMGALVLGASALVRPQALLCAPFLATRLLLPSFLPATKLAAAESWSAPEASGALGQPSLSFSSLASLSSSARAALPASHAGWRRAASAFAALCVVGLLTIAPVLPWTARNCRVMDGCALVSTNAGWNLAIGAFPRATGRFETLHASDGCRDVTGQVEQDRCWFAYGVAQIKANPKHWLALVPAKLGFTFDHESFPVEYLHEAKPEVWTEAKRVRARDFLTFVHRLLLIAAGLGTVGGIGREAWKERSGKIAALVQALLGAGVIGFGVWGFETGTPTFWPLVVLLSIVPFLPLPGRPPLPPALVMALGLLITTVLAHAAFFGEDRYHVVVTPIFCLFAAAMFRKPAPKLAPDI